MSQPSAAIIAGFVVLIGLLLGGYGLALWLRIRDLRRRGQASGVVVDNEVSSYARGQLRFRPVVRFRDRRGQEVTFVGAHGRNRSYVTGSPIAVVYDPDDPRRAAVGAGGAAVAYGASGLVITAVGIMIFLALMRA